MERPNTILGLTAHLARTRWQQLSGRGRFLVAVGGAVLAMAGVHGARVAMGGGCCSSSCASMRAAHEASLEAAPLEVAPATAAAPTAASDCPYTH